MNENNLKYIISIIIGYYLGNYLSEQCLNEFCIIQF